MFYILLVEQKLRGKKLDLFITTFESVAVLLGIGLLGFYIIKKGIIPGKILSILSPLALEIALPSLIFVRIVTTFSPEEYPDWWQLPIWWILFTSIVGAMTFLFSFVSKKEIRQEFAITLFFQNAIFFPLAILSGLFSADSSYVVYLFFFTVFYPPLFFSTYPFFFKTKQKIKINLRKIIHPVLITTIIAIAISIIGFNNYIPDFFIRILILLGGMTIPLIMIILGGNIYNDFQKKGSINLFEIAKFVTIKNFIFPIIFLFILINLKDFISYNIALILMIQSAMPPITSVPIVTERVGGNRSIVNQFIVSSFITSLISIPLMLYLFGNFFSMP